MKYINKITGEIINGDMPPDMSSYQVIPDDSKPYGVRNGEVICLENDPEHLAGLLSAAKEAKKAQIIAELELLDQKSIRALRASETSRLSELEAEAVELRALLLKIDTAQNIDELEAMEAAQIQIAQNQGATQGFMAFLKSIFAA